MRSAFQLEMGHAILVTLKTNAVPSIFNKPEGGSSADQPEGGSVLPLYGPADACGAFSLKCEGSMPALGN